MLKNWMPTLGGILIAVGGILATNSNATVSLIGKIAAAIGAVLLGGSAKQFNVTGGTVAQTKEAESRVPEKGV